MRHPRLIHKCNYFIQPQDYVETIYDEYLKESIGTTKTKQGFEIRGQPNYLEYFSYGTNAVPKHQGLETTDMGYILFRYKDSDELGWKPQVGDKIVYFNFGTNRQEEKNVYISRITPLVHFDKPYMFKAYFTAKHPARVVGDNTRVT